MESQPLQCILCNEPAIKRVLFVNYFYDKGCEVSMVVSRYNIRLCDYCSRAITIYEFHRKKQIFGKYGAYVKVSLPYGDFDVKLKRPENSYECHFLLNVLKNLDAGLRNLCEWQIKTYHLITQLHLEVNSRLSTLPADVIGIIQSCIMDLRYSDPPLTSD